MFGVFINCRNKIFKIDTKKNTNNVIVFYYLIYFLVLKFSESVCFTIIA